MCIRDSYYTDEPARHRFVRRIFDDTAGDYDRIEKVLALGSGPWYRGRALRLSLIHISEPTRPY